MLACILFILMYLYNIPAILTFIVIFAGIIDKSMIERNLEADLFFGMSFQPAVAILGPRQVGKTTLAKKLQVKLGKESVYFDLEDSRDLEKIQQNQASFLETFEDKTVILDEVQRLPGLFPELRGLIDRKREPGRFILLGSASFELLKNTSESLTGRISYFELKPLLLNELDKIDDYKRHWLYGGFPNAYLAPTVEIQRKWMVDFIRTYLERDLPQLGLTANPIQMRRLLLMIASMQGNLLNQSMLANSLSIRSNTISNYLDFLEQAFLIRRVHPFYTNIGKRLTRSPKIYIRDSGILHHLLGIHNMESLLSNASAGGSWEGYVIEQVLDYIEFPRIASFYRTADGAELDLIVEEAGQIKLAIEIKLSNTPKLGKGTTIALSDLGNPPLLLVTPSAEDHQLSKNIRICSLKSLQTNMNEYLANA